MHISFNGTTAADAAAVSAVTDAPLCITRDCDREAVRDFYENTRQ